MVVACEGARRFWSMQARTRSQGDHEEQEQAVEVEEVGESEKALHADVGGRWARVCVWRQWVHEWQGLWVVPLPGVQGC